MSENVITYAPINKVGPANASDGSRLEPRAGSYGELIVKQLGGRYMEMCRRGYVFAAIGAAAAAVPIATTLTNAPALWNPSDSNKVVVPLSVQLSLGAIGTPILQGFTISYLLSTGSTVATGLPIATFTNIAPTCLRLGQAATATTKYAGAVATYTVNPARLIDLGFGHHLEGAAASGQLYSNFGFNFDGQLVMAPGTLIALGSTIATSTTYWTSIIFAEIPLVVW